MWSVRPRPRAVHFQLLSACKRPYSLYSLIILGEIVSANLALLKFEAFLSVIDYHDQLENRLVLEHARSCWSVGSRDRVETNGRTDGGDCITSHANAVGKDEQVMITY